ncbi:60S acidic ribosomal protein P1-beta [Lodderomyces elongisporus]|uniref:60S acidic ribosomal protein P1-B n=1 Tax=Lodderomyces elongisporus (strain ATCC 11503 / CBS 2605 / JCM 1781 / NBRC 1676 / NRRL YB-4239) TaxID=379508 RepID=A5E624_LODEL|nr:60S acidic ribosomal protein P1-beta [Lodderomyces elongisporus]EDK46882.1 60S acidic ribosomal protein P1-B [Lodderomyces elongisporus NRRL YB-4239]WLF81405.1 60S acidic ribosomal protein P1-beta [Lodderomyces elongisporus]
MSQESSVSYAALILADAGQEITSDKLLAITKAAGAEVDSIWADIFAKAVEGKNLKELLFSFAASAPAGGAAPAAAAGGAAAGGDAAAEEAKEEEAAEESDDDMGFGLFD